MAREEVPQNDPPRRVAHVGRSKLGDEVESPTLPLPPPRSADELEQVLVAIASTPAERRTEVVEWIDGVADKDGFAELLHRELLQLPTTDASRTGLILSVLGQLRSPSSAEVLERFVWLDDSDVLRPPEHEAYGDDDHASSMFGAGMLQSRAAEMLVWVTDERVAPSAVRVIREHPSPAVRLATIDAVAFSADDDDAVLERLREIASEDERGSVGLPRRRGEDTDQFLGRVADLQDGPGSTPPRPRPTREEY